MQLSKFQSSMQNCPAALLLTGIFCATLGSAQNNGDPVAEAVARHDRESDHGSISSTIRIGEDLSDADFSALAPLFLSDDRNFAAFTNAVYNHRDNGAESFSIGLGARVLIEEINVIAGFRIHGDFTESQFDNQISQLGLGVDLFTAKGIDFHGNFYLPESDKELAREIKNQERFVERQTFERNNTRFGNPFAQGNSVLQEQIVTREKFRRTTITDVSQVYQQFESGRRGGDLRAIAELPFFKRALNLRAMFGAYHYDGSLGQGDLSGAMAGLTASPLNGVSIGAEYYDDEEVFGSNWLATVSVSMEVDSFQDVFRPNKWGQSFGNAFSPTSASSTARLRGKMFNQAPRNNRVVVEVSDPIEDVSRREVTQTIKDKRIAKTTSTTTKTIADGLIFVNNGGAVGNGIQAGSAVGTGTAEMPVDTIQAGANIVGAGTGTVYVQETGTPYVETVTANGNAAPFAAASEIVFTSSFKLIQACGGLVFGGNTDRAQLAGRFALSNLNAVTVEGFDVNAPASVGITSTNNDNFVATHNIVNAPGNGIQYFGSNGHVFTIADNTITSNGQGALRMQANNGTVLGTIDNNTTNGAQHGLFLFGATANNPTINITSFSNNTFNDSTLRGVFFRADNSSTMTIEGFTDNTFNNAAGNSVRAQRVATATLTIEGGNNSSINPTGADYGLQSNTLSPGSLFQLTNENGGVLIIDDTTPTTNIP